MPYREDEDALLARNDALEREAEELRRENQRLRENAPMIERRVVEVPVEAPRAAKSSVIALSLSLQWRTSNQLDWMLVPVTLGGAIAILAIVGASSVVAAVVCVLIFFWLCMRISVAHRRREIRREQAWIDARPCGLDPKSYRALLSEHHDERRVVARVGFARELTETERRDAATRLGVESRWEDDLLVIESPMFSTLRIKNDLRLYESPKVHGWVHELVERLQAMPFPVATLAVLGG